MRGAREAPAPRDLLNFRRASLLSRNEFETGTFTLVLHATSSFTYVSVIYGANFPFKGALSRFSVFSCRFFAVENGGEETRGAGQLNEKQAFAALFFFFTCSKLRDRSTSEYQSVALAKSFVSRTKLGFEI